METIETIKSRFTARKYTSESVDAQDLKQIVEAGLHAPSSTNRQRWKLTVVTNPELLHQLEVETMDALGKLPDRERFYKSMQRRGGTVFYGCTAIVYVFHESGTTGRDLDSSARDTGILVENMALAATSLGYGNCINGLAESIFQLERNEFWRETLQVPDGYEFGIALLIGKTDAEPTPHKINPEKVTWM
ncbi:MAG: nitroreductase family protein [Candidatus Ancillula sp.]|jgi:nitroreductase|nr:nitroreductase family protein [Candidatus Ancillula sp.]